MKVTVLGPERLVWPIATFGSREPCYSVGVQGGCAQRLQVNPRPVYAADRDLVASLVEECWARFPLDGARAELFILAHDFVDGFNGITFEDSVFKRNDGSSWEEEFPRRNGGEPVKHYHGQGHCIVIAGKSVPHHPAMLRYLIAHEYGHAVFNHLRPRLGYDQGERTVLEREYLAIRGVAEAAESYTSGAWHLSAAEVIANDFRVLVMGREREFWPHPHVPPPTLTSPITDWWAKAFAACKLTPRFAP